MSASDTRMRAPFSEAECLALIAHQTDDTRHPLTCPEHSTVPLDVYWSALRCEVEGCVYRQMWAPAGILGRPDAPVSTRVST